MIRKEQVRIGMRIVGDDPESPESYPYKGTVTALCETGRNETDFYIVIKLDGESMRLPEISRCCPEGTMRCFPWTVSPEEKPEKQNNIPSLAYTAVETSRGFLFFTHTEEGRRNLREFLQEMGDTYFEPSFDLGPVCVYETEGVLPAFSPVNPEKISLAAYPYVRRPEDFRLDIRYRNWMRPTAEDFRCFCRNTGCSAEISPTPWRPWNVTTGIWKHSGACRKRSPMERMRPARPGGSCKDCWTPPTMSVDTARQERYWMIPPPRSAWRESGCPLSRGAFSKPASGCTCPVKSGPPPLTRMHGWIGIRTASSLATVRPETVKPPGSNGIRKRGPPLLWEVQKRRRALGIKCKIVKSRKTVWKRKTRQHL